MTQELIVIQLAAILVASSYDNAQPVIKWGGLVVAVGTVVASVFGGWAQIRIKKTLPYKRQGFFLCE